MKIAIWDFDPEDLAECLRHFLGSENGNERRWAEWFLHKTATCNFVNKDLDTCWDCVNPDDKELHIKK